ncbi:MAG: hypothetical protein MN733_05770, partial [Nitrososphaera sp.]|nr:hypothetical protein [Nitrososphaera sp.]
ELIFNSILTSFDKINELFTILVDHTLEWKTDVTIGFVNRCLLVNDDLFTMLSHSKGLTKQTREDFVLRKQEITGKIKYHISIRRLSPKSGLIRE